MKVFQGKSLSLDFAMVMQVGKLGDGNLNKAIADGLQDTKAPFDIHAFLPARSARSSEGVSLFLLFLARRLVKTEKLCFLVHGKFIICFVRLP